MGASYTREAARIFFQRTCESILSTKEEARKKRGEKKRCRKKRQMRGAVGGLGQEQARRFMAH